MNRMTIASVALWCAVGAHLLLILSTTLFGLRLPAPGLPIVVLLVVTTIHALRRYSLTTFLVFAVIAFVVSNGYENLSILTGFPFGNYYYTDVLGPKLFLVPVLIAPAYFAAGYFAWSIAHILLGLFGPDPRGRDVVFVPVIASLVMVMWDMVMDPINATIGRTWVWEDGGSYFGVPVSNYLGWLLCVYTIFQLFAFYLAWRSRGATAQQDSQPVFGRSYWYQAIIPFFTISLALILRVFADGGRVVADPTGYAWSTTHIYESMTLVAIFTMWFVCLLSALLVARAQEVEPPQAIGLRPSSSG
ncbi:carotene biosynthesis associated membrane protein [Devosia sp. LC5]|uniref:carotenoid biosynthesis protein n=1 Tax=Devosia sp. LC5 TaxID=1502724 RepID=UPI0004E3AE47|nr:carotenoid biosynthesis protein [Devosia sp. LC5]KFC62012.1 carotene biosynthesis associated membrane protein [Devosia sp. LC5]